MNLGLWIDKGASRRSLTGQFVWFTIWLIATMVGLYMTPSASGHGTHTQLGLPACGSMALLGRPCPGCGLTTSWTSLIHGHIVEAFQANWFGPILYLGFTFTAIFSLFGYLRGWRFNFAHRGANRLLGWLVAGFVVYGTARFALVRQESELEKAERIERLVQSRAGIESIAGSKDSRPATSVPKKDSSL